MIYKLSSQLIKADDKLIKIDDTGANATLSALIDFQYNSMSAKEYYYDLNAYLTKGLDE
nr:hypothetical protein [uncultured Bacteroides sp.]